MWYLKGVFIFEEDKALLLTELEIAINYYRYAIKDLINIDKRRQKTPLEAATLTSFYEQILSASLISAIYSLLENSLVRLCNEYKVVYKLKIELEDYPGNGIWKLANYLEEVVGLKSVKSNNWQIINKWRIVRNCIVHDYGIVKDSHKNSIMRVVSFDEDEITGKMHLLLNFYHALDFLDETERYIRYIFRLNL